MIGKVILSYKVLVNSSVNEIAITYIKTSRNVRFIPKKYRINKDVKMKIKVPSRVLLLTIYILPYLIPNTAAVVSDTIEIIIDIIAISLENNIVITLKPIIIYVALIKCFFSYDLITYEKKYFINELNTIMVFLNVSIRNRKEVKIIIKRENSFLSMQI